MFLRPGGIPARSEKGERLLLFIGIIDILQSYRLKKKLEHTFKSIIHDGVKLSNVFFVPLLFKTIIQIVCLFQDTVSVCRPSFYAQRFQNFMAKTVFRKIPSRKFRKSFKKMHWIKALYTVLVMQAIRFCNLKYF